MDKISEEDVMRTQKESGKETCPAICGEVIDFIEGHLTEDLDLDMVADAVHYSKYHLHRLFVNEVGLTIHDYVQRRRLTEAARLLVFSDKPILEIALLAGYESQQAFTSIFKEMYKKTPGQYREDEVFYPLQLRFVLNENPAKFGEASDWKRRITVAEENDVSGWMELVRLVIDGFPYLDEEQYVARLREYIGRGQALILKDGDTAIGIMAFHEEKECHSPAVRTRSQSGSDGSAACDRAGGDGSFVRKRTGGDGLSTCNRVVDFLGVHPQYKKQGIAEAFLAKLWEMTSGAKRADGMLGDEKRNAKNAPGDGTSNADNWNGKGIVTVTTFRDGDKADTGYREMFQRLGFAEAELLVEFGYPTQRLVLQGESWKGDEGDGESEKSDGKL